MKIVQATIENAEEILKLQKLAYHSEAELYNNYNISPITQTIGEIKDQFKNHIFLKALSEVEIVGTVRAYEKDGTCYIGRLAVSPKMQNQGIGRALLVEIESYFKANRFELFTGTKSEKNINLYQRSGYSIFKKEKQGCGGAVEICYMEKFCK